MLIAKCRQRIAQYLTFLEKKRYIPIKTLSLEVAETTQTYRTVPDDLEWKAIDIPFQYGKAWTTYWFRTRYCVSEAEKGRELYLHFTPHAESLVFVNGKPISAVNILHEKVKLTDSAIPGETFEIAIETYSGHPYPGMDPFQKTSIMVSITSTKQFPQHPFTLSHAGILGKNQEMYDLYYDALLLLELAEQLPEDSLRKDRILNDLFHGLSHIRFTADDDALQEQLVFSRAVIRPLLEVKNSPTTPTVYAIGHAHIDHAWLWPIKETHRKVARTFACMSQYAKEFPEFKFIQSHPVQLEVLKEQYPDIFEEVKRTYHNGQWEPNGGMYVEADCNIPNGESLIRQFLVGRLTTEALLDYRGDTLWLPDVFGYAANLPQILKGCEIDYFVTSKINWNDTTRFPYDTFLWHGIDGTAVNTHYITARKSGYNGKINPAHLFDAWNHVQHKEIQSAVVFPVGEGDGGGGTLRSDLELAKRVEDLEGCPKLSWTKVSDALKTIFEEPDTLPQWRGELYLEIHRGTYTSQAKTKMWNRRLEYALRETEILSSLAMPKVYHALSGGQEGVMYPAEELLAQWKELLIHQFHDIIPGSSIKEVYDDAMASYEQVERRLTDVKQARRAALHTLFDTSAGENPQLCFNSLSWARNSKIALPAFKDGVAPEGLVSGEQYYPLQKTRNLDDVEEYAALVDVPAMGGQVYYPDASKRLEETQAFRYEGAALETPFYQIRFDETMRIASLIERDSRKEFVKPGMALNTLQSAEDVPIRWDAWDIDLDYQLKLNDEKTLLSSEVISNGPSFLQIRNQYQIGKSSTLAQDLFFYAAQRRIDFVTKVDWKEDHQLLKVLFPLQVHAERVKCEIQYGHVERDTHTNTFADRAQFEFCAHKWVALDDGSFGAALLNDCKYGYDANGGDLRLTLLKSAKAPDPEADMGRHDFTYAFLPYQGAFTVENVVRNGYDLNVPVHTEAVERTSGIHRSHSFFQLDNPNVILETIKKAEKGEALILRLYNASSGEQSAALTPAFPAKQARLTDMMEEDIQELPLVDGLLKLKFNSFEIKTLKLVL